MQLNKEEIIFKADFENKEGTRLKACSYCGVSGYSHIHKPNTLPVDLVTIEKEEEKDHPNCLRCAKDISSSQLRREGIIYCYDCEDRLELLRGDLEFLQVLKGGREKALEFSARMIKEKKQSIK